MNPTIDARLSKLGTSMADVEERFVRGGGPGGQKINKTSSTVALLHRPTGMIVRCQQERSQTANRELAWNELVARLEQRASEAAQAAQQQREQQRRRTRQKSRAQKARMIEAKKHRSKIKHTRRGRFSD